MYAEKSRDERFLIDHLSEEIGMEVPGYGPEVLRALMNIRMPGGLDPEVVVVQDRYLRDEIQEKGITDVSDLSFRDGMCLWRGDITTLRCDAIVNAANSGMTGCYVPCHRCIDNAIHTYAGMQLRDECARIMDGCQEKVGGARITSAYNLPCSYVIHTVGPMVSGELTERDKEALRSCYRSCLELADVRGLRTVAFCCISTGEFRFPAEEAACIAVSTVKEYLKDSEMEVIFDVFTDNDERIYRDLLL